jgi:hypothetical protein
MKKHIIILFAVMILFALTGVSQATVADNFDSYNTGALSTVSGGTWGKWNNFGPDAQVVAEGKSTPNAITFTSSYEDVVTYNAGNLLAGGMATFSVDFYIKSDIAQMGLAFQLGSGNSAGNSINYKSSIANILVGGYGDLDNEVHIWNPSTGAFPRLTTVSLDAWHNLSLVAYQTGSSKYFDVYIDGFQFADNYAFTTNFTDINGFNALEIYTGYVAGTSTRAAGSYLVDNISLTGTSAPVPVPAAVWLLGSGLLGLFGVRRKFVK